MSNRSDSNLEEICGLWERTSQSGREYIGGRVSDDEDITIPAGSFVMIFPNDSDNPRAPAFRALFSPPQDGESREQRPPQKGRFDRFKGGAAASSHSSNPGRPHRSRARETQARTSFQMTTIYPSRS